MALAVLPTILVALGSGLATFVATGVFYRLAKRLALLPKIRARDVHTERKPRVGGLAIWLATLGGFLLLYAWMPTHLALEGMQVLGISLAMVLLLIIGLLDDIWGVPAWGQLLGQFGAGLLLLWGGVTIDFIRLPWSNTDLFFGNWSGLVTVVWIAAIINVVNWFDGLDGLAASIAATGSATLAALSLRLDSGASAIMAALLAGSSLGFLPWNWSPSKLFMGTVGSQVLGFWIATAAIISGGKMATAAVVLGIPVLDAVLVIAKRLMAGEKIYQADQRHLHHRLLRAGLSASQVVLVISGTSLLFGVLAFGLQRATDKGWLLIGIPLAMMILIILSYILERRRAHLVPVRH